MSQSPAKGKSEAAKERAAKKAAAIKAAEQELGQKVKLTIAKPKKKSKGPKRPQVFHLKVSVNTKTGEVKLEKKAKAKAKSKAKAPEISDTPSPDTA